jgi:NitT/TauT family transport system substrate-binding protein
MTRVYVIAIGAVVAVIVASVVAFLYTRDPHADLPRVRVVINTWPGLGPYYVARAKDFDIEEGVKLDVVMNEDTSGRNAQLVNGEADLVGITLDYVIIAQANNLPTMVVIGESDFSDGGDGIIAVPEIKTVADLKGKKVACAEGLPSHFFLLYLLRESKLGPKDITLVPADDGGKAAFAFLAKNADAAVTWDPWISQAKEKTKDRDGHVIVTTKATPGLILGVVAANKSKLSERADRIMRAQKAWFKAVEFCKKNPAAANAIMAKEYNVPVNEFGPMIAGAKLADLAETKKTFGTAAAPGPIYQLAKDANQLWLEAGVTKKSVTPEAVIDRTIVDKLLEGK